jgi:hypothetical protein
MRNPFPLVHMSYEQLSLLTAQLLVYHQYLQRKVKPSVKRDRTLRVLLALLRRLYTLVIPDGGQTAFLLTVEEVSTIKEALAVLQQTLETKRPSAGRDQEIQRLATMKTLIERAFPLTQD